MTNTSATGGILPPVDALDSDLVFSRAIQQLISGLSGIQGELVRERWQMTPPQQPSHEVDWCAVGVVESRTDGQSDEIHDSTGQGTSTVVEHEELTLLASFYGPNARQISSRVKSGLKVNQNWEVCTASCGAVLIEVGSTITAPAFMNNRWIKKLDLTFRVRRAISVKYDILNLLSAHGTIYGELDEPQDFTVEQ